MYGYGAGAGTGGVGDSSARGEGEGGGGWVRAVPVGVMEISDQQSCFVPITHRKKRAGALLAGIGLGLWLGCRHDRWSCHRHLSQTQSPRSLVRLERRLRGPLSQLSNHGSCEPPEASVRRARRTATRKYPD